MRGDLQVAAPRGAHDAAVQAVSFSALHAELVESFSCADIPRALACLNARTRFRFTGLYRVERSMLRNLYLIDRENPGLLVGGDITPLSDTYCSIVAGDGRAFTTRDATTDERVRAHPARATVLSYMGVPVRGPDGCVAGTLCHFDVRPRIVPDGEVAVLELAATLLPRSALSG